LFAGQLTVIAAVEKAPETAMSAPPYDTAGRLLEMRMVYPTIATLELAMMNGARSFVLSASTAKVMVKVNAPT
jgi:hypothetical protein